MLPTRVLIIERQKIQSVASTKSDPQEIEKRREKTTMEEKKTNQEPETSTNPTEEKVKETLAAGKEALSAGANKLKEKAKELKDHAQSKSAAADGANPLPPHKNKKFLLIGAAVLVLILLVSVVSGGGIKIDMKDYVAVTFTGLDGKGNASLTVDYTSLAKVAEISTKKSDSELVNTIYLLGEEWAKLDLLQEGIHCTMENAQGLSNGDKVTVNVTADDDTCKKLNIKVKNQTITFTAEGLTEVTNFDAFADIEVIFDGIAPQGKATLLNNSRDEACMSYTYRMDVNSGLSNGDTVTVTIDENGIDWVAERTGKAPEVLSKQYTVSGLSAYVTELSQISDEVMANMRKEAEDIFNAYVAKNWSNNSHMDGMTYLGSYFLTKKPHSSTDSVNTLFLVYEVSYRNTYNEEPYEAKYYYYTSYRDLYLDSTGKTTVNLANYGTPRNSIKFEIPGVYSWNWPYAYGYATLPELYQACVTSNIDNYTYESSAS